MRSALSNSDLAELLIREAEKTEGHREQAFRRAAHAAFMWPEEASALLASGRPLSALSGIGPSLARRLAEWIEHPPARLATPENRREFLTLAEARRILARDPAWAPRVQGDLQMHTEWSDGGAPVAEMAAAAIARGYHYIAITDHTKGLKIAGGLDETRLAEQGVEIRTLNSLLAGQGIDFTILRGAEVNLSSEGASDMDSAALLKLDVVLGCFHSALRRTEDQTERYLAGLCNPDIQILGHPQTRVYNRRDGLTADWPRVFGEAARLDKAVEIDAYADRQDLRVSLLKIARAEGTRISLGTDAHHPDQLAYMELGLAAALKAKIKPERIVSFLPKAALLKWVAGVRRKASQRRPASQRPTTAASGGSGGRVRSGIGRLHTPHSPEPPGDQACESPTNRDQQNGKYPRPPAASR